MFMTDRELQLQQVSKETAREQRDAKKYLQKAVEAGGEGLKALADHVEILEDQIHRLENKLETEVKNVKWLIECLERKVSR